MPATPCAERTSGTVKVPSSAALLVAFVLAALMVLAVPAARAAVGTDAVGVYSEELERSNSADPVAVAAAMRDAHVAIVREPFSWARIETTPGHLDFSVYDGVMAAAAGAGLRVLPVLMDPPPWRSTAPQTGRLRAMYPPRDPADMALFATALVDRYGPRGSFWAAHPQLTPSPIHSWQIWNEPNIPAFWATGPDPAAYVRLLAAVSSAIRGADPTAEVVAGGLPYAGNGITVADFIAGMYAAGARGGFDTLAIHPYAATAAGVLELLRLVRAQLDGLGDPTRPIWATEFGWATGGPPVTITNTEAVQATLLRDTVTLMQRASDVLGLRGFVAFRWRDVAPNSGQTDVWALHTGLLRGDGTPKPALDAFRDAADAWRQDPTPAQTAAATAALQRSPLRSGARQLQAVAGVSRRTLRIRRFVVLGRLIVLVDVPRGAGSGARVNVTCEALRNGRVMTRQTRHVSTRDRVARAVFRIGRSARRQRFADELRVSARHGDARATRALWLHRGPGSE